MAWSGMAVEILVLPFFLLGGIYRSFIWALITFMWFSSIFIFRLHEGLIALIVIHFFIFEPLWFQKLDALFKKFLKRNKKCKI